MKIKKTTHQKTANPIAVPRSVHSAQDGVFTTMRAGVYTPVWAKMVHREEAIAGRFNLRLDLKATARELHNAIIASARIVFVPFPAHPRYLGDPANYDYSWQGVANPAGGSIIPFAPTVVWPALASVHPVYRALGVHAPQGATVNDWKRQLYACAVNHLYEQSPVAVPSLDPAAFTALAPALWNDTMLESPLPSYDLSMLLGNMPVQLSGTAAGPLGLRTG